MADILVVDDDRSVAVAFERFLKHEGHAARFASNAQEGLRLVGERTPDLVIMDIRMPGTDGLTALPHLRDRFPDVPVVMMTAYGTSQTSIDAIRAGAFDYITKPPDLDELRRVIGQVLAAKEVRRRVVKPDRPAAPTGRVVSLVGDSAPMQQLYKMIGRLAATDVPALIVGEHGTGKQLVISTIHENSARRDQPLVSLDCGALSDTALDAGIFGATTGTLFLAEVDALPIAMQVRLARLLHEQEAQVGGAFSARVLASTERDLPGLVETGAFSAELHDVLAVITLRIPPLRDRREDIPQLVRHLVQQFSLQHGRSIRGVDDRVDQMLRDHNWLGNVAELEGVIKRACIVARSDVITAGDIGDSLAGSRFATLHPADLQSVVRTTLRERLTGPSDATESVFHDIVSLVEAELVKEALAMTGGNQVKASELLGLNRTTLRKKAPEN